MSSSKLGLSTVINHLVLQYKINLLEPFLLISVMVEFDINQLLRGGLRLYCDSSPEHSTGCGLCEPDELIALQTCAVSW